MSIISKVLNFMPVRNKVKSLQAEDADFYISNGFVSYPRAHFTIDVNCPTRYLEYIQTAYERGWLKPVANLYDYEYTMDKLKEDR